MKRLGADMVLEMGIAEDLCLVEEQIEFLQRYNKFKSGETTALPMLASTCPGWVCYTEKTKGHLLPYLSSCRSPQQIMGRLLKSYISKTCKLEPHEIYHVSLMPCFDKKLEASRPQFTVDNVRDVDCVITPVEINELIRSECENGDLTKEESVRTDWPWALIERYESLSHPIGSGSGGYAQHILSYAATRLVGSPIEVPFENVNRRPDVQVAHLQEDGESLKIAVVTGFRNIQNLVNKIKRGTCDYHYVEVMACPTGCLNGGAQIKGHIKELNEQYQNLPRRDVEQLHLLYDIWLGGFNSAHSHKELHTTFEALTVQQSPLSMKW